MYAVILGCFVFFDGKMVFEPQERYLDSEFQLRVNLPLLIEKGVRAMSFHPAIHALFSGKTLNPVEGELMSSLDERERALWSRLDGAANIEYIMTWTRPIPTGSGNPCFCCIARIGGVQEGPPVCLIPISGSAGNRGDRSGGETESRDDPSLAPPPFSDEPLISAPQSPKEEKPAARAGETGQAGDAAARELKESVEDAIALRKRMGSLDLYQLFGVPSNADVEYDQKSVFQDGRKFHPDRYGRDLDPL
jgi:hypothetical protein